MSSTVNLDTFNKMVKKIEKFKENSQQLQDTLSKLEENSQKMNSIFNLMKENNKNSALLSATSTKNVDVGELQSLKSTIKEMECKLNTIEENYKKENKNMCISLRKEMEDCMASRKLEAKELKDLNDNVKALQQSHQLLIKEIEDLKAKSKSATENNINVNQSRKDQDACNKRKRGEQQSTEYINDDVNTNSRNKQSKNNEANDKKCIIVINDDDDDNNAGKQLNEQSIGETQKSMEIIKNTTKFVFPNNFFDLFLSQSLSERNEYVQQIIGQVMSHNNNKQEFCIIDHAIETLNDLDIYNKQNIIIKIVEEENIKDPSHYRKKYSTNLFPNKLTMHCILKRHVLQEFK